MFSLLRGVSRLLNCVTLSPALIIFPKQPRYIFFQTAVTSSFEIEISFTLLTRDWRDRIYSEQTAGCEWGSSDYELRTLTEKLYKHEQICLLKPAERNNILE